MTSANDRERDPVLLLLGKIRTQIDDVMELVTRQKEKDRKGKDDAAK